MFTCFARLLFDWWNGKLSRRDVPRCCTHDTGIIPSNGQRFKQKKCVRVISIAVRSGVSVNIFSVARGEKITGKDYLGFYSSQVLKGSPTQ